MAVAVTILASANWIAPEASPTLILGPIISTASRKRMSQVAERPLPAVGDRNKIRGQLEEQVLLGTWSRGLSLGVHVVVEEAD